MRSRRYLVGLLVAMTAVGSIIIAGPAGAITNTCKETMNPSVQGSPSGLTVACTFTNLGVKTRIDISDYADALWHSGATRSVAVWERRILPVGVNTGNNPYVRNINPDTPATQLKITSADVNHSIEGPGIAPGTFVAEVKTNFNPARVYLSQKTVPDGFACGNGGNVCNPTNSGAVLVANSTARRVNTGQTFFQSNDLQAPVSAAMPYGANFQPSDVGSRISGGEIPDGATISEVINTTEVHLACTGCDANAFDDVTNAANVLLTITPATAVTTHRYVADGTFTHINLVTGTIGSASNSAAFANTDIGLRAYGTGIPAGARIIAVAPDGTTATINKNLTTGPGKKYQIGLAEKTASTNGSVAGQLSLTLNADPQIFPTAPRCSTNKVSAFQYQLLWRNPGAFHNSPTFVGIIDVSGTNIPGTSTAQLEIYTSATRFSGFVLQGVAVSGGVGTTTGWTVSFPFLPVAVGVCPATGMADTITVNASSVSQQQLPLGPNRLGTGPAGTEWIRQLLPEPQGPNNGIGTATEYVGSTGATVHTGLPTDTFNQPASNDNSCWVHSPNRIDFPCLP